MRGSLSGTLATMGCAVPYAIGAKFAHPDRQRFELTLPELDVRRTGEAPPGCVEHVGRGVDRDDALDVRGDRRRWS